MPIYNLTSQKTGKTYPVNFDSQPSETDVDEAIAHFDIQSTGIERRASVEPQLALNEELRQKNLNAALGGIPFRGASEAYAQGVQAGRDIGGGGKLGDVLGGLTGTGAALGTIFNPITKAGSNLANIFRAAGEDVAGTAVGGVNKGGAILRGEQEAEPFVKFGDTTSTAANLGAMILNAAQTEPVNTALAVGGGIEGIRNPVGTVKGIAAPIEAGIAKITPNIVKRGAEVIKAVPDAFKKNVGRVATDVFKPTADTAKAELIKDIESGALHDDLRNIQEFGKPKNAEQMLENGLIATDNLINLHNDFVSQFPDQIISTSDIAQSIRSDAAKGKFKKQNIRDGLNEFADRLDGEDTLQGSFETLQELNDMRRAYYEKSNKGQLTDLDNALHEAEQAARDQLSTKLDDFYRSQTGATDNPYRQYGSLKGRVDDLTLRLTNLLTERNIEVSKGPTLEREVLATVKKNLNLLKGGEKGRIDNRIARMFDLLEKEPTTNLRDLTPEENATLQQERATEQSNITKKQAAKARAERGVGYKKANETRAEYAARLKQKRADLLAREGASPEELQQGGAAATTLSEMERAFQSNIEAQGLNKALQDVFPEVNQTERSVIERELQSATPKEARDIMSQLLNEQFQIGEQGAMNRISKDFDKVLRKIRREKEQRLSTAID